MLYTCMLYTPTGVR